MIAMLIVWVVLAAVTLPVGLFLVALTGEAGPREPTEGDVTVALWIGLFAQSVLLLLLAVAAPLYPWGCVAMPVAAVLAAIARRHDLAALIRKLMALPRAAPAAIIVLAAAVAFVSTSRISNYDSALYHIQFMRWLARDGLVPGLGLLHIRLGIPSSWFAVAAAFDAGPLQGHMVAAVNGYAVLLIGMQTSLCLTRILIREERAGDWLLAAGWGLLLFYALWTDTAVSASPDLPVAATTVLIGWVMAANTESSGRRSPAICMLLAGFGVGLKLSAAPLLVVAALYGLWHLRASPRRLVMPTAAIAVILGVSAAASVILSGCPVFPDTVTCLNVPWTITPAEAARFRGGITDFARWYASPVTGTGPWDWVLPYFLRPGNRLNPPLLLLAFAALGAALAIRSLRRRVLSGAGGWILALALADLVFVMINAPDTRFAVGAIALIFAEVWASGIASLRHWTAAAPLVPGRRDAPKALLAVALLGGAGIVGFRVLVVDRVVAAHWALHPYAAVLVVDLHSPMSERWLFPPTLPVRYGVTRTRDGHVLALQPASHGDVPYGKPPLGDQCWGAAEPCTPEATAAFRLRRPTLGLAGGFVRAPDAPKR
jgi:hypothetical protein